MTTTAGLQIRHLSFLGPQKPVAAVHFGPGFNVLYGASDTGKSFVADAIDFMLHLVKGTPKRIHRPTREKHAITSVLEKSPPCAHLLRKDPHGRILNRISYILPVKIQFHMTAFDAPPL